jgi:hypothetical protein
VGDPVSISSNLIDHFHQIRVEFFERIKDLEEAPFLDLLYEVSCCLEENGMIDRLFDYLCLNLCGEQVTHQRFEYREQHEYAEIVYLCERKTRVLF